MNRPTPAPTPVSPADTGRQEHQHVPGAAEGASTHLDPAQDFPTELPELTLEQLQVLHSRACLQLEREYLDSPEGAHPVTLDRHQDLVAELHTRHSDLPTPAHP